MSDSEDSDTPDFSQVAARDPSYYITQFLSADDINSSEAPVIQLSKLILSRELSLLKLIQLLGDYITADDDELRGRSVACLSKTLNNLSLEKFNFNANDLNVLAKFLLSKLDDVKSTSYALLGISSLVTDKLSQDTVSFIIKELFEYKPESHLAATRYQSFLLLEKLYPLVTDQNQFIKLFIHIATNEKDPRNLLISFKLNSLISSKFTIVGDHTQDLFDLLYCYFPITFKPPKNDPYKITQDQLKSQLQDALISNQGFEDDLIETLLEKLSNSSNVVKLDSLNLLFKFYGKYNSFNKDEYYLKLFNCLKFEIQNLNFDDDEDLKLQPLLSEIITQLISNLSSDQLLNFKKVISNEFSKDFNFNNKLLYKNSIILSRLAKSNLSNFNYIFQLSVNKLLNEKDLNVANKRELVRIIIFFLDSYQSINDKNKEDNDDQLLQNKDKILIFLTTSLMSTSKIEVSLRNLAIQSIIKLLPILTKEEILLILQYLFETLINDHNEYIFTSSIQGINSISDYGIINEEIDKILNSLQFDSDEIEYFLKIFKNLTNEKVLEHLINKLLVKFIHSTTEELNQSYLIVKNVYIIISTNHKNFIISNELFHNLVKFLINYKEINYDLLDKVTDLIKIFVINMSLEDQRYIYQEFDKVYQGSESELFHGLEIWNETRQIYLILKTFAGLPIKLLPSKEIQFSKLISFIQSTNFEDQFIKIGYLQFTSLIVNKFVGIDLSILKLELESLIDIEIFTWITQSLIIKMDYPIAQDYISKLVDVLTKRDISSIFKILNSNLSIYETTTISSSSSSSSSSSIAKVKINNKRLLYRQKFYSIVIPQLIELYNKDQEFKYLKSLLILLNDDNGLVVPYIQQILQIFIKSKDDLLNNLQFDKFEIFCQFLLDSMSKIEDFQKYFATIFQLFQKLTNFKKISLTLKSLILQNLRQFINVIPLHELIKLKSQIIKYLEQFLDDGNRSIRKLAIDVRQVWFELGVEQSI
ncbi:hypothetical protein WICMUC_004003 [Wickerhamomyces mucosus]|uniref:MMS19 nucleotide excision repair protein n=1 Tax=Wickerhamomyces mucosus TaxID=1378264 RepID=A0A9P8TBE3_9ASCO|nr:hypothetical protein WICMUC_004003 [Wickerhamomyces mucosus]